MRIENRLDGTNRAAAGLRRLVGNHQGLFFKVVRAYAFTPQDQEDLFQEIAAQVWRSIPGFRGDAITSWASFAIKKALMESVLPRKRALESMRAALDEDYGSPTAEIARKSERIL
jgi:DNA-directed RNA polymerase specialized sigma24 family protein